MFGTLRDVWALAKAFSAKTVDDMGFSATSMAGVIIGVVVCVVVAVGLLTTITKQTYDAQNNITVKAFTGALGMLPLLPLFYAIGLVILPVALIFAVLHETG